MNELSEIKNIGQRRAAWLEATFGARHFRDLASLSPDEIERRLKAQGKAPVSRATIEGWVSDAEARASAHMGPRRSASEERGSDHDASEQWAAAASFVVEFQSSKAAGVTATWRTNIHHLEGDRDVTWEGIDCEALCRWMTGRLPSRSSASPKAEEPAGRPTGGGGGPPDAVRPRFMGSPIARAVSEQSLEPATLIQIDRPWSIVVEWSVETPLPVGAQGRWFVDVVFKPIGHGPPLRVLETPVPVSPERPPSGGAYVGVIPVAAGRVTSNHVPGPYRATALITYRVDDNIPLAGVADLGLLRFYEVGRGVTPDAWDASVGAAG